MPKSESTAAITGQGFSVRMGLTAATAAAAIRKTADAVTESPAIILERNIVAISETGWCVATNRLVVKETTDEPAAIMKRKFAAMENVVMQMNVV